jgi:hypothetical protein
LAFAIARTVHAISPQAVLFGLAGSQLIRAAQEIGLGYAQEAFMDRTYQNDGTLTSRSSEKSLITDPQEAAQQALSIVLEGRVQAVDGALVEVCRSHALGVRLGAQQARRDERGTQRLIALHDHIGDRAGAIRRYAHLRQLLDEEMGVLPMAETRALYEGLVKGAQMPTRVSRSLSSLESIPPPQADGTRPGRAKAGSRNV